MLKKLEKGIYIPEYNITIPWLIKKSELKNYIPEKHISYNRCKDPCALFTLLGVKGYYFFNFRSHFEKKLCGISFYNDQKEKTQWFDYIQQELEKRLGLQPELRPFWKTKTLLIKNSIYEVQAIEGVKSASHGFSIRFNDPAHEKDRKEKAKIKNKPLVQKAKKMMKPYNLSICEYHILGKINIQGPLPKNIIAKFTKSYCDGDRLGGFSIESYQKAIKSCLAKKWIEKISQKQRLDDEKRFKHPMFQNEVALLYQVGYIDLTPEGFSLYNKIGNELYKKTDNNKEYKVTTYVTSIENNISILTSSKDDMLEEIEKTKDGPEHVLELNQSLEKIGKPYKISNWWTSRHEMITNGWRVDIRFKEKHNHS